MTRARTSPEIIRASGARIAAETKVLPLLGAAVIVFSATAAKPVHAGVAARPVPVTACPGQTAFGPPGRPPATLLSRLTAGEAKKLTFYAFGGAIILAPRDWRCSGTGGSQALSVWVTNPHARGERVAADLWGNVFGPALACIWFEEAAREQSRTGGSCERRPAGAHVTRVSRYEVRYTVSSGRYRTMASVLWVAGHTGAATASCTLPSRARPRCETILDDFRWRFLVEAGVIPRLRLPVSQRRIEADREIGPLRIDTRPLGPSLPEAIAAFGEPGSTQIRKRNRGTLFFCEARWPAVGLTMSFHQGFQRDPHCPSSASFTDAVIDGGQWRTDRGLALGDSAGKVTRLYPSARWHRSGGSYSYAGVPAGWWLVQRLTRSDCDGNRYPIPTLLARVRGGVVVAFEVRRNVFLCD